MGNELWIGETSSKILCTVLVIAVGERWTQTRMDEKEEIQYPVFWTKSRIDYLEKAGKRHDSHL